MTVLPLHPKIAVIKLGSAFRSPFYYLMICPIEKEGLETPESKTFYQRFPRSLSVRKVEVLSFGNHDDRL